MVYLVITHNFLPSYVEECLSPTNTITMLIPKGLCHCLQRLSGTQAHRKRPICLLLVMTVPGIREEGATSPWRSVGRLVCQLFLLAFPWRSSITQGCICFIFVLGDSVQSCRPVFHSRCYFIPTVASPIPLHFSEPQFPMHWTWLLISLSPSVMRVLMQQTAKYSTYNTPQITTKLWFP